MPFACIIALPAIFVLTGINVFQLDILCNTSAVKSKINAPTTATYDKNDTLCAPINMQHVAINHKTTTHTDRANS